MSSALTGAMFIGATRVTGTSGTVHGFDPRTGEEPTPVYGLGSGDDVAEAARLAADAFPTYRETGPKERAGFLGEIFHLSGHAGVWLVVQQAKLQLNRVRRLSLPEKATTQALIDERRLIAQALQEGDVAGGRARVTAYARRVLDMAPDLRELHPNYVTP